MADPSTLPTGQIVRESDRWWYVAVDRSWVLEWSRFRDSSDGPQMELRAVVPSLGKSSAPTSYRLTSSRSRAEAASVLTRTVPGPDWKEILEPITAELLALIREGQPGRWVVPQEPDPHAWFVPGLIPLRATTILYADGGSSKSYFAAALCLAALSGQPLAGLQRLRVLPPVRRVLWLDWEDETQVFERRLWSLARPMDFDVPKEAIMHQEMGNRSLVDALPTIRRHIESQDFDLAIFDSMGAACQREPESSDAAIQFMTGIATLPLTRFVVSHISKVAADSAQATRPYGSVYVVNLARSTIEARRSESVAEDTLSVTYLHRKSNHGPMQPPFAIDWLFDERHVLARSGAADLETSTLSSRILAVLGAGAKTVSEIADELSANSASVKTVLNRLGSRNKVIRLDDHKSGPGREAQWGRVSTSRNMNG